MANDIKLAVFASGNGTNFAALLDAIAGQQLPCQIVYLVVDKQGIGAINIANAHHIPVLFVDYKQAETREAAEAPIIEQLQAAGVKGVLMAGFMRLITNHLLEAFPQKIINIHPALLPSFPGIHGIKDAFDYGVKITGVTVHYVDEEMDSGKIIDQATVRLEANETLASLEEKIHDVEHHLYPTVLAQLLKDEVFN
ncbi:phosphoribosylglycinamide formyltransferase [Weissella minor]|uniref:phosphoribosylglycinamide formyltransferase n=1 Tax=Weissella minor TaxID=1620 RepID=UPI003AF2C7CA